MHTCSYRVFRQIVCTHSPFPLQYGLGAEEIGVITPLRQQQNLIREKLHTRRSSLNLTAAKTEVRGGCSAADEISPSGGALCGSEDGGGGDGCEDGDGGGGGGSSCHVEVNTVDKYQGRDKECIIVSCTRSNPKGNVSTYCTWCGVGMFV